jgi:hypothetical protein
LRETAEAETRRFLDAAREAVVAGPGRVFDVVEQAAREAGARFAQSLLSGAVNLAAAGVARPDECGAGHRLAAHSARTRKVVTMTGMVTLRRAYHYCRACGKGVAPADQVLGLAPAQRMSVAVGRAVTAAGRELSFARAQALVDEITGWPVVSAKTCHRASVRAGRTARALIDAEAQGLLARRVLPWRRPWDQATTGYVFIDGTGAPMVASETAGRTGKDPDGRSHTREVKIGRFSTQTTTDHHGRPVLDEHSTSYVATFDPADQFGSRLAAEALRRDFAHAPRLAVVGDGAPWIWNLADRLWPRSRHIVDYYHARHHVTGLVDMLAPVLGAGRDQFEHDLLDCLDAGDTQALALLVASLPLGPGLAARAATATAYFTTHHHRRQYHTLKQQGYFIGSGAVESACKNLVEQRAAQTGMRWTTTDLDPIISLRTLHQSHNRYHLIWETPPTQTPRPQAA